MKVTALSAQIKNPDRINVSIDGKYKFSLDIYQVVDFGIKVGKVISPDDLIRLEAESVFGKLYIRALEYVMIRPRSAREVRDYLWRKTQAQKYKSRTGEIKTRDGVDKAVADRVFDKLEQKGRVDDLSFARWWIDNRKLRQGASLRKLQSELMLKGVSQSIISEILAESSRDDDSEIDKIIAKKRNKYPDEQKLISYLARQGFSYDLIKQKLRDDY